MARKIIVRLNHVRFTDLDDAAFAAGMDAADIPQIKSEKKCKAVAEDSLIKDGNVSLNRINALVNTFLEGWRFMRKAQMAQRLFDNGFGG